jgi:ABC-type xylose transport system permease subunit
VPYSFYRDVQLYGLAFAILLIGVAFELLTHGLFLSNLNMSNLGRQVAILGVAASGVSVVIIMGEFDLSIGGATVLVSSIVGALLMVYNQPGWLALPVGLVISLTIGLTQGYMVTVLARSGFRVASFIVTLAGMLAYPAVALVVLPQAAGPLPDWFAQVGPGYLAPPAAPVLVVVAAVVSIAFLVREITRGRRSLRSVRPANLFVALLLPFLFQLANSFGLPVLLIICLVWAAFIEILTQMTVFGRHAYAVGGNRASARLLGVNIGRTTMMGFLLMGVVYWLCGMLTLARLDGASPLPDTNFVLQAIAAAAIGGVSLVGGRGRPYNSLLGALLIVGITNGLNLLNVPSLAQNIVTAIVLVVAVTFDVVVRNQANQLAVM